jgi:SAM-dependent methyltransferase
VAAKINSSDWFKDFFAGATLDLWRRAKAPSVTEDETDFLIEKLSVAFGGRLLDVPCGNGRLSNPLALQGYRITGVDLCAEFIQEATATSQAGHLTDSNDYAVPEFIVGDMRQLLGLGEFDGAYCMGNSFGYFDRTGTKRFLSSLAGCLKSKARFVLDSSMIAEAFLVNGAEREWLQLGDMYMLVENQYDCVSSAVETTYTFLRNGQEEKRSAVHWIYTVGDLSDMLNEAGFTTLELLSSMESEPFSLGCERLILIAEKQ